MKKARGFGSCSHCEPVPTRRLSALGVVLGVVLVAAISGSSWLFRPQAEVSRSAGRASDDLRPWTEELIGYSEKVVLTADQERVKAEKKASATVTVVGHLFDKAVLNRLLDILVDSPCKFRVASLEVPAKDEQLSQAVIEVWADEQVHVAETVRLMRNLVEANSVIAECSLQVEENKL